ncbi:MAG: hypothetical protein Q8Q42_04195 [Nanoarchaeota archaeon]|nr:hypothetical protein [Nanoarchaeota archaeon]
MNISVHLITSLILAAILYPFIGLYSLWIIVGGYLIDFDHLLWTMYRLKSISIKKSYFYHYNRHKKKGYEKDLLHIFHTVEFWIFMILASIISYRLNLTFFYYMFLITFAGMILHLVLDFISLIKKDHLNARAISLIMWIKRNFRTL